MSNANKPKYFFGSNNYCRHYLDNDYMFDIYSADSDDAAIFPNIYLEHGELDFDVEMFIKEHMPREYYV